MNKKDFDFIKNSLRDIIDFINNIELNEQEQGTALNNKRRFVFSEDGERREPKRRLFFDGDGLLKRRFFTADELLERERRLQQIDVFFNDVAELNKKERGYFIQKKEDKMLIEFKGVSISKKQRKDGRFQGYVIENGKKIYLYGKSIDELTEKIKAHLKLKPSPKDEKVKKIKSGTPTLNEWLDKWVELYKKPNVKPKTLESIRYALAPIRKEFGNVKLNNLQCDELQRFLVEYPANRQRAVICSILRQSLERAKKQGLIKLNPCDGLEIKSYAYGKRKALTVSEQSKLLETLKGNSFEGLFVFLLTTGLRIGEALALTSDDVDTAAQTVSVNKDVVFLNSERIVQDTPKTKAGVRHVPVPDCAFKFIKDIKGELFPVTYNLVRLTFARLRKKTGINVSAHILRHTYATRLEEAGFSPKVRQYLLGHSNVKITENTYTDVQKSYIDTLKDKITGTFSQENSDD